MPVKPNGSLAVTVDVFRKLVKGKGQPQSALSKVFQGHKCLCENSRCRASGSGSEAKQAVFQLVIAFEEGDLVSQKLVMPVFPFRKMTE